MANCYICGRPLNESRTRFRRHVKTGEWVRSDYRYGKPSSIQKRFGSRIVCKGCAKRIDARDFRSARSQWIQLGLILGVIVVLLVLN